MLWMDSNVSLAVNSSRHLHCDNGGYCKHEKCHMQPVAGGLKPNRYKSMLERGRKKCWRLNPAGWKGSSSNELRNSGNQLTGTELSWATNHHRHEHTKTSTFTCSKRSTKAQRTIVTVRSNNGSYFRKSTQRQQQHAQQHAQQQQQEAQHQQQQRQQHQLKQLQFVRLYARRGGHLRRRRKRRFFTNSPIPFCKSKAIKAIPMHTSLLIRPTNKQTTTTTTTTTAMSTTTTVGCSSICNQSTIECTSSLTNPWCSEVQLPAGTWTMSLGKSGLLASTTMVIGPALLRLLLTTFIAMIASTTTRLSAKTAIVRATTLPTLFHRHLQRYHSCCWSINGLYKYSWIFLLIYLNSSAKGKCPT